ncbi:uncharacterized protein Z519_01561 [Cladophialophora bantiana CBS 173.52]|uniref:Uncharacterized protein n=1 Tax=Cladophialophora bantiana (strain ATCC 10958 / CBS 173.52 / CDC B-1940 / NIH 8579) TaxID=1442370 RepID=A0A0D2GI10_CLAB1|nr:uncharacterized protein Z519_01561 [Cladophialophora bantiana CBS 173.52]KIW97977.1 hypothetical protein Z519_01561 [Cladophialophora bantiana CBS 173.52]
MGVRRLIADRKSLPSDVTYDGVTPLMPTTSKPIHVVFFLMLAPQNYQRRATVPLYGKYLVPLDLTHHPFRTALHFALAGPLLPEASVTALMAHADPWVPYWAFARLSGICWKDLLPMFNLDTVRVLIEHGGSCIDFGWSPYSGHDPDCINEVTNMTVGHLSQSTPEDFLWVTASERINLMGLELDLFYMSMAMTQCRVKNSNIRRIYTVFSNASDLSRLVKIHDSYQSTVLHRPLSRPPYVEDDYLQIVLQSWINWYK